MGLSQALTPRVVKALEESLGKTAVVWLEGQDCAGCTESFVNSLEPLATSILLDSISLRYHEVLMAASGHQAEEARAKAIEEGGYLLVIEGSIPMADDGLYCTVGGKTFKDILSGRPRAGQPPSFQSEPAPPMAVFRVLAQLMPLGTFSAVPRDTTILMM